MFRSGVYRSTIQLLAVSALESRPAAEALIGLKRLGLEVSVLAPENCPYSELVKAAEVPLATLPPLSGTGWQAAMSVRAKLRAGSFDLLYLDAVPTPCAMILATAFEPPKTVVRLSYTESMRHPGMLARALFRSSRVAAISSDVSPDRAGDALTSRWLANKLTILPPAHSTDWYRNDIDLQRFGIPEGAFSVAAVSDRSGDDGLRWLISSAHSLPMDLPIHFLLIAPEARHESLRRVIRKMPFTQRFHLIDESDEAPGIIASAKIAVVTDWRSELQRRSCMQCFSLGVPVLAVDAPDVRQIVQAEVNGALLSGGDPEALAHCIFELYEHRERHALLAAGAKRTSRNWTTARQQVIDLYAELEQLVVAHR